MKNWLDRDLQLKILHYLQPIYPNSVGAKGITTGIFPDNDLSFTTYDDALAQAMDLDMDNPEDHIYQAVLKNLYYLY